MQTTDPTKVPHRGAQDTLTERYVHAATRRLGEDQRDDVALELRSDVADRVDSMRADDPTLTQEQAEHAALVELGDPDALAASYAGTRQQLIGPEHFPAYVRTLKAITVVAVPSAVVAIAVIDSLTGQGPLETLGRAAWIGFSMVVHIAFWVTLTFAIVERSDAVSAADLGAEAWRPEQLPEVPRAPRGALGETCTNLVWLGILGGLLVWQQVTPFVSDGEERLPVLDPDLWSFWLPLVLATLLLEAGFEVVKYRAGGTWTTAFAIVNMVTAATVAAPVIWLAHREMLLNPDFVTHAQTGWPEFDPGVAHAVVLVSAVAIWAWDTVDGWRRTRILD